MTTLRELFDKERLIYEPIKIFKVKSRTNFNPDLGKFEEYQVELWGDGKWTCNCLAGSFNRLCHHKKEKIEDLKKEFGLLNKAIEHYRKTKYGNQ